MKKKEIKKHQWGLGTIAVSRIYIIHVSQCELPTSLGNPSFNKKYYEVASLLNSKNRKTNQETCERNIQKLGIKSGKQKKRDK